MTDTRQDQNQPLPDDPHAMGDADTPSDEAPLNLLSQVQKERDDLEQRLLRTAADYQNFIKRAHQNVAAAEQQALFDVAKSLVIVMDHFDRALDVDESKATATDVLAGLRIVHDELLGALAKFGVKRVDALPGTPFDPMPHEALMRQPAAGIEPDHVAQQFQPGYVLNQKTVRAAQVSVAE